MITHILAFLAGIGAALAVLHVPVKTAIADLKEDIAALKAKLK